MVVPSDLGIDVWRTQRALERSLESEYHGILCNHHHYIYIYLYNNIYIYVWYVTYVPMMYVCNCTLHTDRHCITLHCITVHFII